MVDPGATHNFVSLEAVRLIELPLTPTKTFGVSLGTGEAVQGEGECKGLVLNLQGISVVEDFLPLTLGNSDLILGVQWLEKLGTMTTNWRTQTLTFKQDGEWVTLKGDPSLGRTLISLKAMIRTIRKEEQGVLVEFNCVEGQELRANSDEIPEFLKGTLKPYSGVFASPSGLPPWEGHEHAITLEEGSNPVL